MGSIDEDKTDQEHKPNRHEHPYPHGRLGLLVKGQLGKIGRHPSRKSNTLATLVATQPSGDAIMSIAHKKLSIVSGSDQGSEETVPDAFGVRITNEGAELFHTGTYVGKQPALKAIFAGSEVIFLPNQEEYTPNPQATKEANLHAAFDEPIDTDWPAQSFVPDGLFVFFAQSRTSSSTGTGH